MEGQLPRVQVGSILTCLLSDQLPPDFTREEYGVEIQYGLYPCLSWFSLVVTIKIY